MVFHVFIQQQSFLPIAPPPHPWIPSGFKYLVSSSNWLSSDLSALKFLSRAKVLRQSLAVKAQPAQGEANLIQSWNTQNSSSLWACWGGQELVPLCWGQPPPASSSNIWMTELKRGERRICCPFSWTSLALLRYKCTHSLWIGHYT